jgi:uncharacterized repeat protein (TIGR02543 family)
MANIHVSTRTALNTAMNSTVAAGDTVIIDNNITLDTNSTITTKAVAFTLTSGEGGPFTLLRGTSNNADMITVAAGTVLTTTNIILDGNRAQRPAAQTGKVLQVKGTLNMNDNTYVQNNYSSSQGGGIVVQNTASATAVVNINNGYILNNESTANAGGILINNYGRVVMHGGAISGNVCAAYGGGVRNAGAFEFYNGALENNIAHEDGGGIAMNSGSTSDMIIDGGLIQNNVADGTNLADRGFGGGLFIISKSGGYIVNIIGNTVFRNNIAALRGGAIDVSEYDRLNVDADVIFQNNSASEGHILDPADLATYEAHIHATVWTAPFAYGYNNFDITYLKGTQALSHTVTFHTVHTQYASQTVADGGTAFNPFNPTLSCGYYNVLWYTDPGFASNTLYDFATPVTADTELYGQETYVPCTYNFSFDSNGGTLIPTQSVTEGTPGTRPADPTIPCGTFAGWYADEALTTPYDFAQPITQNTRIYAKYNMTCDVYFVTFDPQNGDYNYDFAVEQVASGMPVSRPPDPAKGCALFLGWYTAATGGTLFDFSTPITADRTLYAHWQDSTCYTVQFTSNGGTSVPTQTVIGGLAAAEPTPPTYGCHPFGGWYTSPLLTPATKWDFSSPVTSDMMLYAKWESCAFTVSFDSNGGGYVPAQHVVGDPPQASVPTMPANGCNVFAGWYTDPAFTQLYDFTLPVEHDMTLYARWIAASCPRAVCCYCVR